ncbi:MAG: IS110 family transposase [Pseudomonadales bacterium]
MNSQISHYIGLDVHKETIAIAQAPAIGGAPAFVGTTTFSAGQVIRSLAKLGPPEHLRLCHEAGPCGYGLARELQAKGYDCVIVAPSRVARQPADKIKTDRRDALLLARLHRASELTPVAIPDPHDEAIRDLVRSREDAVCARRRARQQLAAFLLRQGKRYSGGRAWTKRYQAYLSRLKFDDPVHHTLFAEARIALTAADERVSRTEQALKDHVAEWRWIDTIRALMTMRGINFLTATVLIAELGDLRRFPGAPALMSYVGLVPSEYSSGAHRRLGAITKTGNRHARRVLIEAAWNYRFPARLGETIQPRLVGQPQPVVDIAWKAQLRLCKRFRDLRVRGVQHNKVCVAIARELLGFVWDIALQVAPKR